MKIFFLASYLCWITRSRTSGYKLQEEISGYQEEIVWQDSLAVEQIAGGGDRLPFTGDHQAPAEDRTMSYCESIASQF